jgi:hypothetical protein
MSHDQDKQCLDDRIMVDTSNAPTPGMVGIEGIALQRHLICSLATLVLGML